MFKFFFEGKEVYDGMPAFKEVFINLLNDERLGKLFMILLVPKDQLNKIKIPEKFKNKIIISSFFYDRAFPVKSVLNILKSFLKGVDICNKEKIYRIGGFRAHGSFLAGLIGKFKGIYNTRRIYGSFLINEIEKPNWKLLMQHPFETFSFRIPGGEVLITNDGTKGDIVFNKIGSSKVLFKFPLNGIDKNIIEKTEKPILNLPPTYICYIARIVDWKRQLLLVESLAILKKSNVEFPHCYIVGPVSNEAYYNSVIQLIHKNGLNDCITVIKGLPTEQCNYLMLHSFATFSLYHTSNLGNVFLEAISLGGVMIAINDTGSLNAFPKDIFIEVKESKAELVADSLLKVINDSELRESISSAAVAYSKANIKSWKERAMLEVNSLLD